MKYSQSYNTLEVWLRLTSTEQLEYVSALVIRALVTYSMPGKISHVHFLAARVADHVKGPIVTQQTLHKFHARHWNPAPKQL